MVLDHCQILLVTFFWSHFSLLLPVLRKWAVQPSVTCGIFRAKPNILRPHFPKGFLKDSLFIIQPAVPVLGYTRNVESCMGKSVRLWKGLRLWKFYGACLLMQIPYFRVSGSPCSGWGCDVEYLGTFCYCWADKQGQEVGKYQRGNPTKE